MDVLVLGGGACGLLAGMVLARDGHQVTVLERDPAGPPEDAASAFEAWSRPGVAQFQQAHILLAGLREVLDAELPDVAAGLAAASPYRFAPLDDPPPWLTDRAPRPGDERLAAVTAKRATFEQVLATAAARQPGLRVRRGAAVAGLVTEPSDTPGVPHVAGVRTSTGEVLRADVVVDAMGRRSPLGRWLADAGGRGPDEHTLDANFVYYTRFFRSADGSVPPALTGPIMPCGSISILTLPGDHGTWSVTLYTGADDTPCKALRREEVWTEVVGAFPLHAHWLDGEPLGGIRPMAAAVGKHRDYVVDGVPVATGVLPLADAWGCTNPSQGRGISLGAKHARRLRDVLHDAPDSPTALAAAWHEDSTAHLRPWHDDTVRADLVRLEEMAAAREGRPAPPGDPERAAEEALLAAGSLDADLFRAMLEVVNCLTPVAEVLARPGVADRAVAVAATAEGDVPGPSREQLLALLP